MCSPKGKTVPGFAGIVFISFKGMRSACRKGQAGYRAVPALRARGSYIHTELQVPVRARNAEQGSSNRMNRNTRDLDNLEVILFYVFIFPPSFLLTNTKSTFCFSLHCKNDKIISKIEIKHADWIIWFIVFVQGNRISYTYSIVFVLGKILWLYRFDFS